VLAIALALGASLAWGVSDFAGGVKSRVTPLLTVLLVSQGTALIVLGVIVVSVGEAPIVPLAVGIALGEVPEPIQCAGIALAVGGIVITRGRPQCRCSSPPPPSHDLRPPCAAKTFR
jgi:hypothetical protein